MVEKYLSKIENLIQKIKNKEDKNLENILKTLKAYSQILHKNKIFLEEIKEKRNLVENELEAIKKVNKSVDLINKKIQMLLQKLKEESKNLIVDKKYEKFLNAYKFNLSNLLSEVNQKMREYRRKRKELLNIIDKFMDDKIKKIANKFPQYKLYIYYAYLFGKNAKERENLLLKYIVDKKIVKQILKEMK